MYVQHSGQQFVLESVYVEMDPVLEGFEGVLVELVVDEHRYVLTETALGTGSRIFKFVSCNYAFVHSLFLDHTASMDGVRHPLF